MNDNTEVRDALARLAFWCKPDPERGRRFWYNEKTAKHSADHPIPNTLDEAAKLPEGWFWSALHDRSNGDFRVAACHIGKAIRHEVVGMWKPSEKTARFETRLGVEKIEHERRGGQP